MISKTRLFKTYIPENELSEINKLIDESGLDEPFDWLNAKYFVLGKCEERIVALVVYGEIKQVDEIHPRFLHIIIAPDFKRTKAAYKVLKESESLLKEDGHKKIIAFISKDLNGREVKKNYAKNFGYIEYANTEDGDFFFKNLT